MPCMFTKLTTVCHYAAKTILGKLCVEYADFVAINPRYKLNPFLKQKFPSTPWGRNYGSVHDANRNLMRR